MFSQRNNLKKLICERVVEDATDNGIRKTDELDNLECFCSDNPPENDFEQKIRGYIFDGDRLILKSLQYAKTVETNETDFLKSIDFSQFSVTVMKEGSAIRVFYYKDKWYTSTHRKINAYKSKWGNKESFGDLFEKNIKIKTGKTLQEFYESTLDKNFSYVFSVGTSENTRIVAPSYNDVSLLATMNSSGDLVSLKSMRNWYLKIVDNITDLNSALNFINNFKYPFSKGCGIFLQSEEKSFKIFNPEYFELSKLRNNLPSIPFAYLHNVFDENKRKKFRELYPTFSDVFDTYDSEIHQIAVNLLQKYFERFVKKREFTVSQPENHILYNIHGLFRTTKIPIKLEHVFLAFSASKPSYINKILSTRKLQQKVLLENKASTTTSTACY